jgi:hypothetical protein
MTGSGCPAPPGAVSADGSVWVADPGAGQVSRMDPGTDAEALGSLWATSLEPSSRSLSSAAAPGRAYDGQPQPPMGTRSQSFLVSTSMVITSPRLDRDTAVGSGRLNLFCRTRRGVTCTPGRCRPWSTWASWPGAFRERLRVGRSRASAAGPGHPAEAVAADHCDQVMLVHRAAAEADSMNRGEPAGAGPASMPPCGRARGPCRGRRSSPAGGTDTT